MQKNRKETKSVKTRSYTITDMGGRPCLRMNGDFLATDYGFETGSRVEVVKDGDVIIIKKIAKTTVEYLQAQKQRNAYRKEMYEISEKIRLLELANK